MGRELRLGAAECTSAATVQTAIDTLAREGGGRLVLPALELELDRGLELRSGVELVGQGNQTVLRKSPGRVYSLTGYHNYGMCDVPLTATAGLQPGMTVSVYDRLRRGFYSTFARITWVETGWVGLDHGIEADYAADQEPVLTTAFPLVFGHGIGGAALRDLVVEGNRAANGDTRIDGCRGGAIYFAKSRGLELTGVVERDYNGEGLSFQMCRDVLIRDCRFDGNSGNGMHPGAGSTGARFAACACAGNAMAGFFFCVRATRITVSGCEFTANAGPGISIGTRDCHNLIVQCTIRGNGGPGILCRKMPCPTEVHSCRLEDNLLAENAHASGTAEIEVLDEAHDLAIVRNTLRGNAAVPRAAVAVGDRVRGIFLDGNQVEGLSPMGGGPVFVAVCPTFSCGSESAEAGHSRHLPAMGGAER